MIEAKEIHKSFNTHDVLKGVSLDVPEGSTVVILGRSGIGKSVLLKSMVGLLVPESGSIKIKGEEVVGMGIAEMNKLRKKIGYVFQYAALYDSLSVRENLEFPVRRLNPDIPQSELDDRVVEQLTLVGLEDAIDKMPGELSGGMKKRIGLARAVITRPEIVLYDEPTAGLDPVTGREISDLMLSLEKQFGMTSVTVTHDLECARTIADMIHIMDDGNFQYSGTFDDLKAIDEPLPRSFFQAVI